MISLRPEKVFVRIQHPFTIKVQLTLEQHGFELRESTCMWIFFFSTLNTTALQGLWNHR